MKRLDILLRIISLVGILGTPLVLFGLAMWKINTNHGNEGMGLLIGSFMFILFGACLLRIMQNPDNHDNTTNSNHEDEVKK